MKHDVFGLDISMDNSVSMKLFYSRADLSHKPGSFNFRHGLTSLKLLIELSSKGHLKDDVDMLLIIEATVHLDYVRVVEIHLDLDFSCKLINYFLLN
jgi:hypothetical protein